MSRRARWWHMVEAAREEALLAVDLYNRPIRLRSFEGFIVHMHVAWTYLLHAEFARDEVDYRYWNQQKTRLLRIDGEPRTWDLAECVAHRWEQPDPVRKNIEFFVGLRNKIEHRYQEVVAASAAGHAQALILNFERELVDQFGERVSMGDDLRFPIFLHTFSERGHEVLSQVRARLPSKARDYVAQFHSALEPSTREDQRFEFTIVLVPQLGPKTEAEMAIQFVREDELTTEEATVLAGLGRTGRVIVRERQRSVVHLDDLRPSQVVRQVQSRVAFAFTMADFVKAWKILKVRPQRGARRPERTDETYCVWDRAHGDYLYRPAFVERIVREVDTEEKHQQFLGHPTRPKPDRETGPLDE